MRDHVCSARRTYEVSGAGASPAGSPWTQRPAGPILRAGGTALAVLAAVVAPVLTAGDAVAQGSKSPEVSFDAFGTLGVVHSTEERADYVWELFRPDGPGHSEELSPDVDSRLGGQVTAYLTPKLTAVVQVVAEQDADDDYDPEVEWASLEYAITPDLRLRAGRTTGPTFLVSDYRKIGYANPWVRPPPELYGLATLYIGDGVDVRYRLRTGDWTTTLQASYGHLESELPAGGTVEAEHAWNVNATLQRGAFRGRAAFSRGALTIAAFDPLFDAFRAFGPAGEGVAERFEVDETAFEFATVGAEFDPGPWFGMAEVGWADYHSILGEKLAGYATGGYRLGPVTPYATYARSELLSDASAPGLPVAGLPPGPAGTAATLNAVLDMLLQSSPVQQNASVGIRWDVRPGLALKLQAEFIDMLDGSPGTFINEQPGFERGGSARLVSLSTDFVL